LVFFTLQALFLRWLRLSWHSSQATKMSIMKPLLKFFAIGLMGGMSLGVLNARANLEVSASVSINATADFYAPLEAHGAWIEVGTYGRCWRPAHVEVGWRPYCYGHWVWTDCGWYWASDEPWGWACYHYGNWIFDPAYAWIWIPGVEWGPAWVSWRVGGGYIGWAPLAPAHVTLAIGAPDFVFVQTSRFHDQVRPSTVVVNNTTIINNTTVINNLKHETRTIAGGASQRVVVNEGPGVELVEKATGKPVKAVSIREVAGRTAVPAEVKTKAQASKGKNQSVVSPAQKPTAQPSTPAPNMKEQPGKQTSPGVDRKKAPAKKEKPSFTPAQPPGAAPEHKQSPSERPAPPPPSSPSPDRDSPGKGSLAPAPSAPPSQGGTSGNPGKPLKGKGKAKPQEKDGEGHGKSNP
jgi:hypothetical protein